MSTLEVVNVTRYTIDVILLIYLCWGARGQLPSRSLSTCKSLAYKFKILLCSFSVRISNIKVLFFVVGLIISSPGSLATF